MSRRVERVIVHPDSLEHAKLVFQAELLAEGKNPPRHIEAVWQPTLFSESPDAIVYGTN